MLDYFDSISNRNLSISESEIRIEPVRTDHRSKKDTVFQRQPILLKFIFLLNHQKFTEDRQTKKIVAYGCKVREAKRGKLRLQVAMFQGNDADLRAAALAMASRMEVIR